MDANAIASADVPVLCIDTCSILDLMRDPTRDTVKVHERQAAMDLISKAEAGKLVCLMAQQVEIEFADHDQQIQDEATRNLQRFRDQIVRVSDLSAVYGSPGTANLVHLNDHVARARAVVGRWLNQFDTIVPSSGIPAKAFARMNAAIPPARRGKDSAKDCLIYESYLEAGAALRSAGVTRPIVFLSSNTDEYVSVGNVLKQEIAVDFQTLNLIYAPNMGAAKGALGL